MLRYLRFSNDDNLSLEDLAPTYEQPTCVEHLGHTIKSDLRTGPLFHWRPHPICAHVSLCELALLAERTADIRAADHAPTFGLNGRPALVEAQLHNRATILVRHKPATTTWMTP